MSKRGLELHSVYCVNDGILPEVIYSASFKRLERERLTQEKSLAQTMRREHTVRTPKPANKFVADNVL